MGEVSQVKIDLGSDYVQLLHEAVKEFRDVSASDVVKMALVSFLGTHTIDFHAVTLLLQCQKKIDPQYQTILQQYERKKRIKELRQESGGIESAIPNPMFRKSKPVVIQTAKESRTNPLPMRRAQIEARHHRHPTTMLSHARRHHSFSPAQELLPLGAAPSMNKEELSPATSAGTVRKDQTEDSGIEELEQHIQIAVEIKQQLSVGSKKDSAHEKLADAFMARMLNDEWEVSVKGCEEASGYIQTLSTQTTEFWEANRHVTKKLLLTLARLLDSHRPTAVENKAMAALADLCTLMSSELSTYLHIPIETLLKAMSRQSQLGNAAAVALLGLAQTADIDKLSRRLTKHLQDPHKHIRLTVLRCFGVIIRRQKSEKPQEPLEKSIVQAIVTLSSDPVPDIRAQAKTCLENI